MLAVTSLTVGAFVSYLAVRRSESFTFPARWAGGICVAILAWMALPSWSGDYGSVRANQTYQQTVHDYERIRSERIAEQVRQAMRRFGASAAIQSVEKRSDQGT